MVRTKTASATTPRLGRVQVKGKFLYLDGEKFFVKGVTYGTFAPTPDEYQFPAPATVYADFAAMAASGFNCVRTYTVPPPYLLEAARTHGLKVMVGLPWEQHVLFLDDAGQRRDIIRRVAEGARACAGHPAVLCYTIGNEIPPTIVRWYGRRQIETFLRELYRAVKAEDGMALVTYVNYPTTEYLDVSFLDFDCFNVYLETPEKLSAYIQRLHNLGGDRPLVLAEIGLDSQRNGVDRQAEVLRWQAQTIFGKGGAGMFVFAWTDEWWRGGFPIEDWDFGLVDRARQPKPALAAMRDALQHVPLPAGFDHPSISVVVCSYNGSATIRETIETLLRLEYPRYEVIVVNDGSTDGLGDIVREYPVRLISTPNRGLSSARNTGLHYAQGEIIAYLDDDAYPEPHWLHYLAYAYRTSSHDCIGGPNIVPPDDCPVALCVANAPGGPTHVLETDELAEHVPGCNLSFRRAALEAIGGFDPVYRAAGDDVDVCWRIQAAGGTIGYHPSALVWHHRRGSVRAYWKQQQGYGKAEALLEAKWPEKYNAMGHLTWRGRIYGNGLTLPVRTRRERVFYGTWGTALFQSVYQPADSFWSVLPLMPEWLLFAGLLAPLAALGAFWPPLLWLWGLFALALAVVLWQAARSAFHQAVLPAHLTDQARYRLLIMLLHVMQPVARLYGRIRHGLTPWRPRGAGIMLRFLAPFATARLSYWSEKWRAAEDWLSDVEQNLIGLRSIVARGGDYDTWDLQIVNGLFGRARCLLAIEEHGAGKQYLRLKCWKEYSLFSFLPAAIALVMAVVAAWQQQWAPSIALGAVGFALLLQIAFDAARAMSTVYAAFHALAVEPAPDDAPRIFRSERAAEPATKRTKTPALGQVQWHRGE